MTRKLRWQIALPRRYRSMILGCNKGGYAGRGFHKACNKTINSHLPNPTHAYSMIETPSCYTWLYFSTLLTLHLKRGMRSLLSATSPDREKRLQNTCLIRKSWWYVAGQRNPFSSRKEIGDFVQVGNLQRMSSTSLNLEDSRSENRSKFKQSDEAASSN